MKLSTKNRYAVMAVVDIAYYSNNKPVSLYEIAERQNLPLDYLEQIFIKLRKHKIVQSIKGPGGGYFLTKPIENITVSDIITAISGPINTVRCDGKCNCINTGKRCFTHNVWTELDSTIMNHLTSVSLKDIASGINAKEHSRTTQPIYIDYQSTTPTDKRALDVMLPYFSEKFGNPHSRSHVFGWESEQAITLARKQIADVINANPKEIIFTSGATESNNLALKGAAYFYKDKKNHIITVQTEHKCVLDTCRYLEQEGFEVTYLPVNRDGLINLQDLRGTIKDTTLLVSIMAVNNEIGVIQPLKSIGKICREHGIFFHTDAAQGFGKVPLDIDDMNIDLMSISSHKVYGPKGVGALFVRNKPKVRLTPLINGGGQERGTRSGTLPTPLIVGFGKAASISQQEMTTEYTRLDKLRTKFLDGISDIPDTYLNGHRDVRWPGNINISFAHVEGESMMLAMKNLAVSSGSACTSESLEPSYVLRALGIDEDLSHTSIRFGLGRFTSEEEIDIAIRDVHQAVTKLRAMSPLCEQTKQEIKWQKV